jgi:phosphoserine phosphatase RsbX
METIQHQNIEAYVYQEAKGGNNESGDSYFTYMDEEYFLFAIADGLGNGPFAKQSSEVMPKILAEHHRESIDQLLYRCNEQMFHKRGAAVAIVKVDFIHKTISYSCVGNVRFYLFRKKTDTMKYPLPVMGYLSGRPQKLKTQSYQYEEGDLFLLHSDGVVMKSPKALLKDNPNLVRLSEKIIDSIKHDDDATFIAGRLLH